LRQPLVRTAFPLGGRPGASVPVEVAGEFLDRAVAIRCDCEDLRGSVTKAAFSRVEAALEIAGDAEPGPRVLYVDSPRGTSNRFLFRVTRWESAIERKPNDQPDSAQVISSPVVVEGRVARLTDTDFYRFRARAGERLAFNVMTSRSKALGFVSITLLDSGGAELAHNNARFGPDPYFEYRFERAGEYRVVLTARRFADFFTVLKDDQLLNMHYQLAIGRSPILWSLWPMGGRRGTQVDAELRADFIPDGAQPRITGSGVHLELAPLPDDCRCRHRISIRIDPDAATGVRYLSLLDDSGNTMYLGFAVGEEPEVAEASDKPQRVDLPVTINGRVTAAEKDSFRIKVNQDDEVTVDLQARGLGSGMIDPQIALVRAEGDLVALSDDRCRACPGRWRRL